MTQSELHLLKARVHHLKPVVIIGAKGLTDAVKNEINEALTAHELIKVKMNGFEKEQRLTMSHEICNSLKAELIQVIGNTIALYRAREQQD